MKWLFGSRDDTVADLRARLDRSEAAREELTKTIVEMKVAGGTVPRPATGFRQEPRKADEIERALDENPVIRTTPGLRRQQNEWARKALEKGAELEDVLAKIEAYGTIPADFLDEDEDDDDEEEAAVR